MGIRAYKPTSAARRFYTVSDFADITTDKPEKKLVEHQPQTGGRNHYGRITSRFRGGPSRLCTGGWSPGSCLPIAMPAYRRGPLPFSAPASRC